MKIVQEVMLLGCGRYADSREWKQARAKIHAAVEAVDWPPGTGKFLIYPESGKKRGEGNGVKPIKKGLLEELRRQGWKTEGPAKTITGKAVGSFDAVLLAPLGPIVLEWETGNISSSHRSLNKMAMLLSGGIIAAGILVVPSRSMYAYLTDRVGNISELEPYFDFWRATPCKEGILEIIVIEQDGKSMTVPRIPKGTDGRSRS